MLSGDPMGAALDGEEWLADITGTSPDGMIVGEEEFGLFSDSLVSFSQHAESFKSRFFRAAALLEI